ncbi:MAG: hypothetical protein JO061_18445 [Acidobacteriaceae bacterium]|nr:hypothetical protein [Acidobacteriaceae bacterium]
MAAVLRYTDLWKPASELTGAQRAPKFAPLEVIGLNLFRDKGLARGSIAEISGRRSSGRTATCWHILAQATRRGEVCAVIDLYDTFHPASAAAAGVALDHLVWVRCRGNAEHAIRSADLLVHAGGFGLILLDLCDANPRVLNRIPLSYWYRFRRAVENTPTILLICADRPQAKSCSSTTLELQPKQFRWSGKRPFLVLRGIEANAVLRSAAVPPEPVFIRSVA